MINKIQNFQKKTGCCLMVEIAQFFRKRENSFSLSNLMFSTLIKTTTTFRFKGNKVHSTLNRNFNDPYDEFFPNVYIGFSPFLYD